ncbi:hypothetical protein UFOVP724_145 [uncultured Caudovirales phage]|uniref:Uncharacterized protein n=1 Tax=uncultured Caudovirales phage TaxID=2100421 RepID=A0A6J5NNK7_9CAUD|nr:hypothetical protein UFOVP724_145 [uncultured Caudovirales phage]
MTYDESKHEIQLDASTISDASNRYLITNFSNITRDNMSTVSSYINSQIYPILKTLTSGPVYDDVLSVGLNGSTIISDHLANVNSGAIFWDDTINVGRPKTLKESLLYIQTLAIGNQTVIQNLTDSNLSDRIAALESDVIDLQSIDEIQNLKLQQIAQDVFGPSYQLNNDGNMTRDTPVISSFIPIEQKAQPDGVATLDSNGKVPINQIPDLAITTVQVVADIAERDNLDNVQDGDVVKTSDDNKVYMLKSLTPNKEWIEISADVQDLSDYARKSLSNTFTANNIFKNDSGNEIITVEDNSQPFAKFIKNQKQFETYNLISGRNLSSTPEDGTSQFYGTALFKTNIIKIGTDPFYDMSGKAPIEIEDDGKTNINMNGWTSINRTVSQGNQSIDNKYFLKLNTNQAMTEDAYILKIGPDLNQESLMNGFFKWKGTTGDFVVHKDPHSNSSDQSLATTNWVRTLLNNSGGNIDTSNFAKLNVNNIYNTGVTNHFKGLIKTDSYIKLNVADSSRITRSHIGNDQNDTPLITVTEDVDIGADTKTVLIDIERDSGFYPLADIDSVKNHAQILWNETELTRSWMLSHSPLSNSNDTSIATTNWVMEKVNAVSGESADPLIKNNIFINEQLKFKDIVGPSIILNYDTTTLESANAPNPIKNAIIQVYRGNNGTGAELKWNESDDVWEVSPPPGAESNSNAVATTFWTKAKIDALSLDSLSDVTITSNSLNNNQTLRHLNGQWVNTQLAVNNLSDSTNVALRNSSNVFTQIQRAVSPSPESNNTDLATTSWVRGIINDINASPITTLNELTDVVLTNPQPGQTLVYRNVNGTNQWINSILSVNDISGFNLSGYAPITSPSFLGAPSLNAQATALPANDNTSRLVTSSWVQNLINDRLSIVSQATFDGVMLDKTLSFQYNSSNRSNSIQWDFISNNQSVDIFKFKNKIDQANETIHPISLDDYFLSTFINANIGGGRPGYQYNDNQLPSKGNYSHSLFYNSMDDWDYNNNISVRDRSRYIVTYKKFNNNGDGLVDGVVDTDYITYADNNFATSKFCYINPYLKDFFLLADNTFFSKGIFDGQRLFVKNITGDLIYIGLNSCNELLPEFQAFQVNQNQRKIFALPSLASIEFVWFNIGSVKKENSVIVGFWYPKIITGAVTSYVPQNIVGGIFPPESTTTTNKFYTQSIFNIAKARKQS